MSDKIDVSREAVEAECGNLSGPAFYHTRALLRALLDRAEKAERRVAGLLDERQKDDARFERDRQIIADQAHEILELRATHDREQAERGKG